MAIILRLKNWQLFFLLMFSFILPLSLLFANVGNFYFHVFVLILFVTLPLSVFVFWFHTVGNFLGKTEDSKSAGSIKFFNYNNLFVFIYIVLIYLMTYYKNDGTFSTNITIVSTEGGENPLFTGPMAIIASLIHFYIMFVILYNIYFIARNISLYEGKDKTWTYFFLILFFPAGLWFLQPKINRLYIKFSKKT